MSQADLSFAKRRLLRDWHELDAESGAVASTIAALPTHDLLQWHANLRPMEGPYAGTIFHVILQFPTNYPESPPKVYLCHALDHPNVFGAPLFSSNGGCSRFPYICLDMLQEAYTNEPYTGWTSAYSVTAILLQIQSFLFDENVPQHGGGTERNYTAASESTAIQRVLQHARSLMVTTTDFEGTKVVHTHDKPWPPLQDVVAPLAVRAPNLVVVDPWETYQRLAKRQKRENDVNVILTDATLTHIYGFLEPCGLFQARNVCRRWRQVIITHNLLERRQICCFHSKVTLDDDNAILGVGIKITSFRDNRAGQMVSLKDASSPLDILSMEAFDQQGVRTGVWGKEQFDSFLPLIFNAGNGQRVTPEIKRRVFEIMKAVPAPSYVIRVGDGTGFQPHMMFQLVSTLMNTMIVQLMKDVPRTGIQRHASEAALEGYCAFHHMLLHFANIYPVMRDMANRQVDRFVRDPQQRLKKNTPNLGNLLVCLTLSNRGWQAMSKPFLLETFDRNVRWNLALYPSLAKPWCDPQYRINKTFEASLTSLRLLMFQVYFTKHLGRPAGTKGPDDVLKRYSQRLGRPTTAQKENLQQACKDILEVDTWTGFFERCDIPLPPREELVQILQQAVTNSLNNGYHKRM